MREETNTLRLLAQAGCSLERCVLAGWPAERLPAHEARTRVVDKSVSLFPPDSQLPREKRGAEAFILAISGARPVAAT